MEDGFRGTRIIGGDFRSIFSRSHWIKDNGHSKDNEGKDHPIEEDDDWKREEIRDCCIRKWFNK